MSNKTLKRIILVFVILTLINTIAIIGVTEALNTPRTSVQIEVLGAAFNQETDKNSLEIGLIRPPRKMVNPGNISEQHSTITNTSDSKTYLRASYVVIVEDADGKRVEEFESEVSVKINEGWKLKDGYWYYEKGIAPNERIAGPINTISYSEKFTEHLDYKVYVPLVVEGVEAKENEINEIDYWPNEDINKVDYKRLNESAKWSGADATIIIQ